jgi:hypothetical protein
LKLVAIDGVINNQLFTYSHTSIVFKMIRKCVREISTRNQKTNYSPNQVSVVTRRHPGN